MFAEKLYRSYLHNLHISASKENIKNIRNLYNKVSGTIVLDVGCDDGRVTSDIVTNINNSDCVGIDINHGQLIRAASHHLLPCLADASKGFPFQKESFDILISNQVIEHVADIDAFMNEVYRVVKYGGYAIISTENASSWVNVIASAIGYQMFSMTNISSKRLGIGNPFAIHRNSNTKIPGWTHKTIFSLRALIEFSEVYDFSVVDVVSSGYFPLPSFCARLDPIHGHFITILLHKPLQTNAAR